MSVGEVKSEVIVDGEGHGGNPHASPDVRKEELRQVVRELLEEMLERYLRVEEPR